MAYTNGDFVWTPDESTPYDYTANLATMGSSIENVAGPYVYSAEGTATILDSTNFQPYTSGNVLRVRREGKVVSLTGTWGVKTAGYIESASNRIFAQVPNGFRPKDRVITVMQGSGTTHYTMTVGTDGKISAARCSGSQQANYWMPISLMWIGED